MSADIVPLPLRARDPRFSMEEMRKRRGFNRMVDERIARRSESRELAEEIVRGCLIKLDNTLAQMLRNRAR